MEREMASSSNGGSVLGTTAVAEESHQLEKLGGELKCSICLSLLKQAASLTCNHCYCTSCILESLKRAPCCPLCKLPTTRREVRPAPHMDNLVTIYKGMERAAGVNIYVSQSISAAQASGPVEKEKGFGNTGTGKDKMQSNAQVLSTSTASKRFSHVSKKRQRQSKLADVLKDVTNEIESKNRVHEEPIKKECKKINKTHKVPILEQSSKGIIPAKKRIQVPQLGCIEEATSGYAEKSIRIMDDSPREECRVNALSVTNESCLMDVTRESDLSKPSILTVKEANYAEKNMSLEGDEIQLNTGNLQVEVPKADSKLDSEVSGLKGCRSLAGASTILDLFPQNDDPPLAASAQSDGVGIYNKRRPKLAPFFWLKEMASEDDCTQEKSTPLTQTQLAMRPTFSDLKDSDDECHRDEIEKGFLANNAPFTDYESDIFAWSQQPCSPELKCSPSKNQDTISPELHQPKSARCNLNLTNYPEIRNEDLHITLKYEDEKFEFNDENVLHTGDDDNTPSIFLHAYKRAPKQPDLVCDKSSTEDQLCKSTKASALSALNMCHEIAYAESVLKDDTLPRKRSDQLKSSAKNIVQTDGSHRFRAHMTTVKDAQNLQSKDTPGSINATKYENSDLFVELSCAKMPFKTTDSFPKQVALEEGNARACNIHDCSAKGGELSSERLICAFCRSSGNSKVAGPLMLFKDAALVPISKNTSTDNLKVHKLCAEWAPDVYFTETGVHNLKAEVARGRKIKCSSCGQKGAALGCYIRRCHKSFHYPCAKALLMCKWDLDNHVILCPDHSEDQFPSQDKKRFKGAPDDVRLLGGNSEVPTSVNKNAIKKSITSKPQKMIHFASSQAKKWSIGPSQKWFICGSALDSDKKVQLASFVSITGATMVKAWSPLVTHVITSTDEQGAARRTLKFLMAILEGKWILKSDSLGMEDDFMVKLNFKLW
ncbi:hypothetical protein O6H91_06G099100 [Diphasiastrum complanatum]|uniref:Uncharacterized protein n=2 Tax=Diphasiastrum complanatum TaxID=34168 RepID=A0ACC2DGZ5_DIPCM|nr:hypothetical protein O6H91_06G099100 [Diphasiastrum complanatum]KAJ7553463.1 hypothetical protein O6H91_06G099100 [Diphasiastrum complanatum]